MNQKPYFLWDYDMSESAVRDILNGKNETEKRWLLSRILESAKFEDVWKYTNLTEIRNEFPYLKLKKPVYNSWKLALSVWQ